MLFSSVLAFLAAPFMFKPAEVKPVTDWRDHKEPIDKLIGWLETKDPAETYMWSNSFQEYPCLFEQFGRALTSKDRYAYMGAIDCFGNSAFEPGGIASRLPRNFGAALQRARTYKTKH